MSWWRYARSIGLRGSTLRSAQVVAFEWATHADRDVQERVMAVLLWKRLGLLRQSSRHAAQ